MKKIYFAGSIRGGRSDAELYRELIARMKETDIVLTEHIGDLSLSVLERGRNNDAQIYEQDTAWIRECDLLIAECTNPSLGVGYELAYAEKLGKPCHILYDRTRCQLSAMLTGDSWFNVYPYETRTDAFEIVEGIIRSAGE